MVCQIIHQTDIFPLLFFVTCILISSSTLLLPSHLLSRPHQVEKLSSLVSLIDDEKRKWIVQVRKEQPHFPSARIVLPFDH